MPLMASRKHAPHPYWNRLWKAAYAWSSFQHVRETCDYILSQKIQTEDTIYYPLILGALNSKDFPQTTCDSSYVTAKVRFEPHGVKFKLSLISEIRELVSALEKRMHEHSNKLVSYYQNDAPDDGEYLIDLTAGSLQPCTFTKSARAKIKAAST